MHQNREALVGCRAATTGLLALAVFVGLYGWAWDRAIGAEYAAVARQRLQQRAAALTFVEELARVGRHRFLRLKATVRAGDDGLQLYSH